MGLTLTDTYTHYRTYIFVFHYNHREQRHHKYMKMSTNHDVSPLILCRNVTAVLYIL